MVFTKKRINSNKLAKRIVFLLSLLIVISAISSNRTENQNDTASNEGYIDDNGDNERNYVQDPKPAGYWTASYIHIYNDNWSVTPLDYIKPRSGTWNDPHIIENVTINPGNSRSGILINNCKQFFVIRNCTIQNSASGNTNGGIKLNNTVNGTLVANKLLSNNGCGILLVNNCNNITIVNNTINNNFNRGISFETNCDKNRILNNTIKNNFNAGVYLNDYCDYNNITKNYIENSNTGIYIYYFSTHNLVANNTCMDNYRYEILVEYDSSYNTFKNNTLISPSIPDSSPIITHGIFVSQDAEYNIFGGNTLTYAGFFFLNVDITRVTIDKYNRINGKIIYYYSTVVGLTAANFANAGQIILAHVQNSYAANADLSYATYGVRLEDCTNITFENITANDAKGGFWDDNSNDIKIINCTIKNNEHDGILLQGTSNYCNITRCIIRNNRDSGIKISQADYTYISNCNISYNENGIWYENYNLNTTISKNNISLNTYVGIYAAFNVQYSKITNNTIAKNGRDAITFSYDCTNNIIANNTIESNDQAYPSYNGITILDNCNGNQFLNNTIKSSLGSGISIGSTTTTWDPCNNNIISGNTIVNNQKNGVIVYDRSNSNKITYNNISKNGENGIYIYKGCNFTTVSNNNITYNLYGIYINDRSNNCTIISNLIKGNSKTGIHINANTCRNATITNNYFVKNNLHANDTGQNNQWNSNFWDDYFIRFGGEDLNKDGIGDIPYGPITGSAGSSDLFPIWAIYRPVIFVYAPSNLTWDHEPPYLNVKVLDPYSHTIKYQLQTINFTLANNSNQQLDPTTWATLSEGQYTVIIRANNTYGMPNSTTLVLKKDTKPPLITVNIPFNNSVSNAPPTINLTAYDPNYHFIWYDFQGVNYTIANKSETLIDETSWNALPNGLYTIKLYANDTFGHLNKSLVLNLYKDTHAPTIRVNSPANGSSSLTAPFINISAFDLSVSNAHIWFEFQGVNYTATNNTNCQLDTAAWNLLLEGYYYVYLFANDSFGYLNDSLLLMLYKDTGPNIFINSPADYSASNSAPYLNVTVYTSFFSKLWFLFQNVNYTIANNSRQQLNVPAWNLLGEVPYIVIIYANDTVGHLSQQILNLYKDITKPSLSIVLPTNLSYWRTEPTIQVVVTDLLFDEVWCVVNNTKQMLANNSAIPLESSIWKWLTQGWFTIFFYANDSAGNLNNTLTIQLNKDTIAPSITVISPTTTDWTTAPPVNVTTNALDLHKIWYVVNGMKEELANNTEVFLLASIWNSLAYGPFTLTIYANDTVGNIKSVVVSLNKVNPNPDRGDSDDDSGTSKDEEIPPIEISFGYYYIPIVLVSVLFCVVIVRSQLARKYY